MELTGIQLSPTYVWKVILTARMQNAMSGGKF